MFDFTRPRVACLFSLVTFIASVAASADTLRDACIVVDPSASPAERYAAEEFKSFFRQSTGIDLEITTRSKRGHGNVYIGPGAAFSRCRLAFDASAFGEEEFRIRGDGRDLAIVGGRPRGTLYAVYQFLEDYLGVRFLTADHTHVPPEEHFSLPKIDFHYAPPFAYRWSYYRESSASPEFAARLRLNTLASDDQFGGVTRETQESHSLLRQVPVAQYGASHPEYFAYVHGERWLDPPDGAPQVCSTNPDVVDVVKEAVFRELEAHPGQANVSVTTNDNAYFCTCPACRAVNEREESPAGAHLTLVNAVADRVAPRFPGVKVSTLAYWYTLEPPRFLRPRPNVQVILCSFQACGLHALADPECPRNAVFMKNFEGWCAISSDIRFWYYNTNLRSLDLPYPNLQNLGPNFRLWRDRGVRGAFVQGNERCPAGELSDLRNYVTSRLLWNPDLDAEGLRDEFLTLHYGKAAPPIRAYIDLVRQHAEDAGVHPFCWAVPRDCGLDAGLARRIAALFEEALALAENEVVRTRVEKVSICAYKPLFETAGHLAFDRGLVHLVYPPDVLSRLPRYRELCARFGMDRNSEFDSLEDYLGALEGMVGGAPGVRLESPVWRLTFIPAFNGELVDLLHKPTNHNYLRAWDRPGINLPDGTLHEGGFRGYDSTTPLGFEFKADSRSLTMTKTLDDGSMVTRRISLPDSRPESVLFDTSIQHRGKSFRKYALQVGAEWDLDAVSNQVSSLAPSANPLGLVITYDNGQFSAPRLERRLGTALFDLKLPTPVVILGHGARFRARYSLRFSERPAIDLQPASH